MLSPIEIEKLADALADRVTARLASVGSSVLDVYGVADLLACSVPTVERMVSAGKIPSFKAGRLRRFDPGDVLAALKEKGGCDHGE